MNLAFRLLVLFAVSTTAAAAPLVRISTDRTTIPAGGSAMVYIDNASDEPAHELRVSLQLPPGLVTFEPVATTTRWRCATTSSGAECTTPLFPSRTFEAVSFTIASSDGVAGHRTASATLAAYELDSPSTLHFDVITPHHRGVTTAGEGRGSLRDAIEEVNANPLCGTDVPCFIDLTLLGPGATVSPTAALPPIRKCNVMLSGFDGWEVPMPVKQVAISGERAAEGNGIEIRAACAGDIPGVTIAGVAIHSWPENGILVDTPSPHATSSVHSIIRSYVGTERTGTKAMPNALRGIVTVSPHDAISVSECVISGNRHSGIALWNGTRASISGVTIGLGRDGAPLGNGASGIFSNGVPVVIAGNTIAHNAHAGVSIAGHPLHAFVTSNAIFANGSLPIDWDLDGRTPPDDEFDAVLNAPEILEAFYDSGANATVIRGQVRLRAGAHGSMFRIEAYVAANERGDVLSRIPMPDAVVHAPAAEAAVDIPFDIVLRGADYRGERIALQTHGAPSDGQLSRSSEISEGVLVR